MSKHPIDEMAEGCRFCAGKEYPVTIEFSCGWCGRKKVFVLVEETEAETMLAIPVKPMPVAERPKLLDVITHD
jgi:hypothetical protein